MNDILLAALRTRITAVFPAQIRAAVEPLTDDELWWRPNEGSNSVANIVIHLAGSLNYYLNRNIGGVPYDRDRDAEFAARAPMSKAEVMARFDDMVARAEQTFAALTSERLHDPSPEPTMHTMVVEDLVNILGHLANHAGQIVWIAKSLHEGAARETWIKTHRKLGAWKSA